MVASNVITLRGSAQIVAEFFGYSINSILYQRGLYDPATFVKLTKYGLGLQVTTDPALIDYLKNVLVQLTQWLEKGEVKRLVMAITSNATNETMERWVFDVETDENALAAGAASDKSEAVIQKEIAAILRQITSSVSFLPLLDEPCAFDLLVYTPNDCNVPAQWEESDPRFISKSNEVRLRSFSTKLHKVETSVAYKVDDATV